ncbi:hypothetical protein [Nocardia sp.]
MPTFSAAGAAAENRSHMASRWYTGNITPPRSRHCAGTVRG